MSSFFQTALVWHFLLNLERSDLQGSPAKTEEGWPFSCFGEGGGGRIISSSLKPCHVETFVTDGLINTEELFTCLNLLDFVWSTRIQEIDLV